MKPIAVLLYLAAFLGGGVLCPALANAEDSSTQPAPTATHGLIIGDPAPAGDGAPSPRPTLFPPRSPAIPTPSPLLSQNISPAEGKTLLKQFSKAQDTELAALKHRQSAELKELKAAHKAQVNEWEAKERDARHKYFADHKKGPDRRAYVQDYTRRRELLLKIQGDEESRRSNDQSVRLDSLKKEQADRMKEFQDFVQRGERPPVRLWPN